MSVEAHMAATGITQDSSTEAGPWNAGPTLFKPADMRSTTWARGFARAVVELDPRVGTPLAPLGDMPSRPEQGDIVVTGGAGFLGARVVRNLFLRPGDDRIYVCSRNPGSMGRSMIALAGIKEASRIFSDPRLMMLPVDLSAGDAVETIAGYIGTRSVRTVIHLAAAVDAFAPRERLAPANETATRNVIAFAASVGARLVHASTLSVFVSSDMAGEQQETSLRDHLDRMVFGGYAQTKAVADMLIEDAAAAGLDACCLRLGLLVPETQDQMEPNSFLAAFRQALLDVAAVPSTTEESAVDLTTVDQAAACITALTEPAAVPTFIHYANPQSATLSMVVRIVLGSDPRIVSDDEWDRLVEDQPSIKRALLQAAFRKSRFLSERCTTRPLANADLFQSTARTYDVTTAVTLGAPVPTDPETICATLFGAR